jgi:hypothetical protein
MSLNKSQVSKFRGFELDRNVSGKDTKELSDGWD